jgi:hypothetical protein
MMAPSRLWIWVVFLGLLLGGCVYHPLPAESQTGCGTDDPRVGYIAELNGHVHGVSGTARIVDNCTIVIEHFNYDGIAVDARVVGVVNNDFKNVIVLSGPIMRSGGYHDETLVVPLPQGITLDDVPVISIDCLAGNDLFGEGNFAEGVFHAP